MGIFDFFKKKPKPETEMENKISFLLTKKQLIWIPVLEAYGKEWPLLYCARRSASAFEKKDVFETDITALINQHYTFIVESLAQNHPKVAIFGKFPNPIGRVALNGADKTIQVHTMKVLIHPSETSKHGFAVYNGHPVVDQVLETDAPLRKEYPALSRLVSIYYDEDFFEDNSEEPQTPLSVMAKFCFGEEESVVKALFDEITAYLNQNPTAEEADEFLTSLGNEFHYQSSDINALEWLEYLRVRLEQWILHGDEPIS